MKSKSGRTVIAKNSLTILEQGFYINNKEEKVNVKSAIENCIANTKTYTPAEIQALKLEVEVSEKSSFDTQIEVWQCSTIEALQRLNEYKLKIGILNFASAKNPGGGFLGGASAQEESLARSSSLYASLTKDMTMYEYNRSQSTFLYSDYLIYSPQVAFWFDDNGNSLGQPLMADVITSPAPNRGAMEQKERYDEIQKIQDVFEQRMAQVLAVAYNNHCDTLILGAWGCGVFRNDPKDVANYFKTVIDRHFKNVFKKIVFAIYNSSQKGENIRAFESEFKFEENEK